jgi:hypothetical protein
MIVSWIGADDFSSSRSQLDASGGSLTWNHLALQSASHISGRFAWAVGTSGTASGFTLTWTIDAAESGAIVVAIFRDENASPIGVNNTNSGSGLTITITQTTGVTSGSYALVCVAWDAQDIKTNDGYPSNSTGIYSDHSTDGSAAAGAGCAYDTTATSSEAYQFTGNAPDQNLGMVIEIKD